jgi:glycine cleavage system aminomethyltransferase T
MSEFNPVFLPHLQPLPHDPNALSYVFWNGLAYIPHTHTNWKEETLSWKKSCYIASQLSPMPKIAIKGPDVLKLLSSITVNNYDRFPVGSIKHVIHCTEEGNVLMHGLAFRLAEDEVAIHADTFYIQFAVDSQKYDVKTIGRDVTFIYQLGGPRSLEIIEQAARQDLHDIKFMRFRSDCEIAGHPVRITRMGMAGTLSYEVQGDFEEAKLDVYNELMRVGKPFGLVKLGINAYMSNHSENGYPQAFLHFPNDFNVPGYAEYTRKAMEGLHMDFLQTAHYPGGTYSEDIKDFYRNPFELGWGHMVKFDHEFVGRAALEKIAKNHREIVTLVWNPEDMMKVFASYFDKTEEPYMDMPFPQQISDKGALMNKFYNFKVLKDGKTVGFAMWRTYTLHYRETISMCCIDPEFSEIGTEVEIIYGDIGQRQLPIRAKVARYPYLDLPSNMTYDVETIPHYKA